jgi:hypothetical protein
LHFPQIVVDAYNDQSKHDCAEAEDDGVDHNHPEDVSQNPVIVEHQAEARVEDNGLGNDKRAP